MRLRNLQRAGFVIAALVACTAAGPARAATVTDSVSFFDVGTYQTDGLGIYNSDSFATGIFTITFDPTQTYVNQSISGFITGLNAIVLDDRFTPSVLTLNPITTFTYVGGSLALYSNAALGTGISGTPDITIIINGFLGGSPASSVFYSQNNFSPTLTTSGAASIIEQQSPVPLPAAVWLFGSVLAGGAGFGSWRRRKAKRAGRASA
jgi:hypothetical protein